MGAPSGERSATGGWNAPAFVERGGEEARGGWDAKGRRVATGGGEGGGLTAGRTRQRQSECTADWRPPAGGKSPSSSAFMESMVRSYLAAHAMTWSALNVALNRRNSCW